jgi:hypothetical protein
MSQETKTVYSSLSEDPPIVDQKYVLLSFAEPRPSILEQREAFFHREFALWFYRRFCFQSLMDCAKQFFKASMPARSIGDQDRGPVPGESVCEHEEIKQSVPVEATGASLKQFEAFVLTHFSPEASFDRAGQEADYIFSSQTFQERYEDFRALHFNDLVNRFRETLPKGDIVVHGVKVRGVFRSLEDAKERAEFLRVNGIDPFVDVFAAEVGKWVPRNPYPDANVMQLSYDEEQSQLNQLIQSRQEEQMLRNRVFETRREDLQQSMAPDRAVIDTLFSASASSVPTHLAADELDEKKHS